MKTFLFGSKQFTLEGLRKYRQMLEKHYSGLKTRYGDEMAFMEEAKRVEDLKKGIDDAYSIAKTNTPYVRQIEDLRLQFHSLTHKIEYGEELDV